MGSRGWTQKLALFGDTDCTLTQYHGHLSCARAGAMTGTVQAPGQRKPKSHARLCAGVCLPPHAGSCHHFTERHERVF